MGMSMTAVHERTDRDHRLAVALLTKTRYGALPPTWGASKQQRRQRTTSVDGSNDADEAKSVVEAHATISPLKRRAAALALQLIKRPRVANDSSAIAVSRRKRFASVGSSLESMAKPPRPPVSSLSTMAKAIAKRNSALSLASSMEGLSSSDTKYLLQTLSELPKEIARLNSISTNSSGGDTVVASKVFGWRHSFWLPKAHSDSSSLPHNNEDTLLIWKATKTFESTDMRPLAKKIWNSTETFSRVSESSKITTWEVLHSINKHARVIRRVDHMHGREEQETIWLECFLDRGNHICIGRKQLRQFRGYQLEAHPTSDLAATDKGAGENLTTGHECEGFLFRPHLTKLKDEYMLGSTLQCISSVAPRGKSSTECLLKHIVDDLPRFTLQWEEALVHDLLPQIRY